MSSAESFYSIAPGRVCLFGEHQDYLGMPVIAMATPDAALSCRIRVVRQHCSRPLARDDIVIRLRYPREDYSSSSSTLCDEEEQDETTITREYRVGSISPCKNPSSSESEPDFAKAVLYELLVVEQWELTTGADCVATTTIPMQAGCSSSTAFCVAWTHAIAELAGKRTAMTPLDLAKLAHRAEVTHFGAPGGTMDHVTIAVGGLLRIGADSTLGGENDDGDRWSFESLSDGTADLGVWVVANSGQPKDTFRHLHRCKAERLQLLRDRLHGSWDTAPPSDMSELETRLWDVTLTNRRTEADAARLLKKIRGEYSGSQLGELMSRHHEALRDGLGLSTERLEAMRMAATTSGAWGYKLVGSGGGGCAVAWTSASAADQVAESMRQAGATETWILDTPGGGARIEFFDRDE
jgi:galactokinase